MLHPDLPVMVRTRDEAHVNELRQAGTTEVVPETLEAAMMIAFLCLAAAGCSPRVVRRMQGLRTGRYRLLREFLSQRNRAGTADDQASERSYAAAVGKTLSGLDLDDVVVTVLARDGKHQLGIQA